MIFLDFINGCSSQNHSGIINTCDSRTMHTSPLGRVVPTSDEQTLPFRRWLARKGEGNSVQSTSRGTVVTRLRNIFYDYVRNFDVLKVWTPISVAMYYFWLLGRVGIDCCHQLSNWRRGLAAT